MKYYYYSIIGKNYDTSTFMKIVCIESRNNEKNSNDYMIQAMNYVIKAYNISITNVSLTVSTKTKYNTIPNVDYISGV